MMTDDDIERRKGPRATYNFGRVRVYCPTPGCNRDFPDHGKLAIHLMDTGDLPNWKILELGYCLKLRGRS